MHDRDVPPFPLRSRALFRVDGEVGGWPGGRVSRLRGVVTVHAALLPAFLLG